MQAYIVVIFTICTDLVPLKACCISTSTLTFLVVFVIIVRNSLNSIVPLPEMRNAHTISEGTRRHDTRGNMGSHNHTSLIEYKHVTSSRRSSTSPSASAPLISALSSASVGFWPSIFITCLSSSTQIRLSLFLSNSLNASSYSERHCKKLLQSVNVDKGLHGMYVLPRSYR